MAKINDIVCAILSQTETTIELIGFGIYEGDFVPTDAAGWMAEALADANVENPRIRLDNGAIVYGCECWWGPEEQVKSHLDKAVKMGREVVGVNLDEVRSGAARSVQ